MRRFVGIVSITAALFMSAAGRAQAQTPAPAPAASSSSRGAPDLEAGVALVHRVTNKGESETYGPGWYVGGSYPVTRVISVIALLTGDYDSTNGRTANIYTYGGGARFTWGDGRIKPFAQVVFGGGQDNGIGAASASTNRFPMLAPGGGADIAMGRRLALRLRLDVPILMKFSDSFVGTRVAVGVSIPFGGQ